MVTKNRIIGMYLWGAFVLCSPFLAISHAQNLPDFEGMSNYAKQVTAAQTALEAGKLDECQTLLDATLESFRGFEYDYLKTRLSTASDGKASERLQFIANPEVETRYAVMNELKPQIVFICRDGSLRIHELGDPEGAPKVIAYEAGGAVWRGEFSYDGKRFVAGHNNGEIVVRDTSTWEILTKVDLGSGAPVREIAIAPDGSAVVGESKQGLELWSLKGDTPVKVGLIGERYNFGEGLSFSPQGDQIATGGMFDILIHDAQTGQLTKTFRHASYTMGLQFSPDGKFIASAPRGNVNKFLAVFDVAKGVAVFNTLPLPQYIIGTAFSPDGKRIAAVSCEQRLRIFDAATGQVTLSIVRPNCGSKPAFSRDGKILGWSEKDGFYFIDLSERA